MANIQDIFVDRYGRANDVRTALKETFQQAAIHFAVEIERGRDPEAVLREMGFERPRALLVALSSALGAPVTEPPSVDARYLRERDERYGNVGARAFYLISDVGSIHGVPSPMCVESKLPRGRKPTEEELRRAIKECSS